ASAALIRQFGEVDGALWAAGIAAVLALISIPQVKAARDVLALAVAVQCVLVSWLGWSDAPALEPVLALFLVTGAAALVSRNCDQPWGFAGAGALFCLSV